MENQNKTALQWIFILLWITVGHLAISCLRFTSIPDIYLNWLDLFLSVGGVFCIAQLAGEHPSYRPACILIGIQVILNFAEALLTALLLTHRLEDPSYKNDLYTNINAILNAVQIWIGLIGTYLLYAAHGKLVSDKSPELSRAWKRFFGWSLAVSLLRSVTSIVLSQLHLQNVITLNIYNNLFTPLVTIPALVISGIHIFYLVKTCRILEES